MALLTIEGASSSSSTHQWEYDVFLNFRGKDTRDNFTSHLHQALDVQGFKTFIDDNLPRGEEISVELLKTIRSSMIWIVVFSKDYASSHWCLDELVEIYKCRSEDRKIIPIFYKVSPSEIREPDGEFGIALDNHEDKFKDKVQTWRETLAKVADLSGFTYKDGCDESEAELIQRVIKEISSIKLNLVPLFVAKNPVGIDSRAEAIELLLDMESNDVFMVGICGLGGIGKTTISKAVYNRICTRFEGSYFLENVREMLEKNGGIIGLQKTLLSKIIRNEYLKVNNVSEGIELIKKKLCSKKVLLVLDGVKDSKEVENLLGDCKWFASGSRVIITTRDKHVLTTLGRDPQIYEVTRLNQSEALQLFNLHAFHTSKHEEVYSKLVKQIIRYAKGLPLALKVIGSDLCGGDINKWKSALQKYENIPHENIQEVLKISYNELEENEKEIFLDIACFFKGYNMGEVVNILDSCDLYPVYYIGRLIDKCLVTSEHGRLSMHDLLQRMGREIVRLESKKLEKRSRIWRYKDAHKLLTRNMGSKRIRGIILRSPKPTEVALEAKVFKRMKNLKFLIGNVHIVGDLEYLPDELRFLEWHKFPLSFSSKCCAPKELVALKLSKSNIKLENALEQGFEYENLKRINLRSCEFITKLPDLLLCCPNLEGLDLKYCKNLIEVHESIGSHKKLKVWDLKGCSRLQILPSTLSLKSLEHFKLSRCRRLEKFPNIGPEMKCLKYLDLFRCGIRELPSSLLYLTGLNSLGLGVSKLTNFLVGAKNFSGPSGFLCLTQLNLSGSPRIKVELDSWMQPDYFPVLESLSLASTDIVAIPESISRFNRLKYLHIEDCKELQEIPELPQSIRTVCATNCDRLDTESSSRLLNQFREILGILRNTVAEIPACFGSERPKIGMVYHLELPVTEIPEWLKFNHHQSVGNSVSFLVDPKFSNFVVCIAIPSKDLDNDIVSMCEVDFFINGIKQFTVCNWWAKGNYDHAWLIHGEVDISNTSEENRIVVKFKGQNISPIRMRIYAECICCPTEDLCRIHQCAFNSGEEDPGRVGIRGRLRRRNRRPTHARRPQKYHLSSFRWLRVRYQLWKPSSKTRRRRITNGFHDQGSSSIVSILNTFLNDDTNAPNPGWDFSGWRRNKFVTLRSVDISWFPPGLYIKNDKNKLIPLC